jgi:hypothetical protein
MITQQKQNQGILMNSLHQPDIFSIGPEVLHSSGFSGSRNWSSVYSYLCQMWHESFRNMGSLLIHFIIIKSHLFNKRRKADLIILLLSFPTITDSILMKTTIHFHRVVPQQGAWDPKEGYLLKHPIVLLSLQCLFC